MIAIILLIITVIFVLSITFKTIQIGESKYNSEQLQTLSSKEKDFTEKYTSVRRINKKYSTFG